MYIYICTQSAYEGVNFGWEFYIH